MSQTPSPQPSPGGRGSTRRLRRHRAFTALLLCLFVLTTPLHAQQRPDDLAPELWEKLRAIDEQLADVETLQAEFIKLKHTPLLKRPLTSEGTVRVKGRMMRWDTHGDHPSTTLMRDGELRLYQPDEKRLEIYPLEQRFAMFGASPQPRLTELVQRFDTEQRAPSELFESLDAEDAPDQRYLALRLVPKDDELREHVEALLVLIDRDAGRIDRLRLGQGAGESVEYRFTDVQLNVDLPDDVFELDLPADVHISRPLEGASE
ncbi:MAG: LolA family protein [Phycisphaeraceae bacterium]